MKWIFFLSVLALPLYVVVAKNDWTKPCLNGSCSFDIARSDTSLGATLTINGSSSSVSDITTAAGWNILNCSTATNSQTIQLVCTDESKGCNHLFQQGAENTIVRLPEDCGLGPFVRVVKHSIPSNQTFPTKSDAKFRRSDGTVPQIQQLQIDGDFSNSVSNSQPVKFSLIASTDPDPVVQNDGTPFSGSASQSPTINVTQVFTFGSETATCTGVTEQMALSINTTILFNVTYSFLAEGTLNPSDVTIFIASTDIDGFLETIFKYITDLVGTADFGDIVLIEIDLPGLSIANVINISPRFTLSGGMFGTFGVEMTSTYGVHYTLTGFASTVGSVMSSNSGYDPQCIPLTFLINPTIAEQSTFGGNIEPTLQYAVSAFGESSVISVNLNSVVNADVNTTFVNGTFMPCLLATSPNVFNVGATGNFFGIIDDSLNQTILNNTLTLVNVCFVEGPIPGIEDEVVLRRRLEDHDINTSPSHNRTGQHAAIDSSVGEILPMKRDSNPQCPPPSNTLFAPINTATSILSFN